METLIESVENDETTHPEVAKWKHTLGNLVPFPVDESGLRIGRDQPMNKSHRHYSHLLALYPLFLLDPDSPEDRELVEKSVIHWHELEDGRRVTGYSHTGAASLYAAFSNGNEVVKILRQFLTGDIGNSQVLSNTFYVEGKGEKPRHRDAVECRLHYLGVSHSKLGQ